MLIMGGPFRLFLKDQKLDFLVFGGHFYVKICPKFKFLPKSGEIYVQKRFEASNGITKDL